MRVQAPLVALASSFAFALACAGASGESGEPAKAEDPAEVAPIEAEPTADPSTTADPSLCQLGDDWSSCVDKRVQIDGTAPEFVMQHPMMTMGGDDEWKQDYMDVGEGGRQIIVLTREPGKCKGAMRVVGTLGGIEGRGEPGTKESYAGWVVRQAEVTCM